METSAASETLRQPGEKSPSRTELRRKDAESSAAANLVDLVEQVEDVESHLQPLVDPGLDRLHDAEIYLLMAGKRAPVRMVAARPEAAPGGRSTANRVL